VKTRIVCTLGLVTTLMGVAACGSSSGGSGSSSSPAAKELTIGFVPAQLGTPFFNQVDAAAQDAANDLHVKLKIVGPIANAPDGILAAAQSLVTTGIDGLAVAVTAASQVISINKIVDGGVPVLQFNSEAPGVEGPFIGEESPKAGALLGGSIATQLGASSTGTVVIGDCYPGIPVLEERDAGIKAGLLATAPGLTVLAPANTGVTTAANYSAWQALLAAHPDAAALIGDCAFDVASLGKLKQNNPNSKFISGGTDLTPENLAALANGSSQVSIGQDAFMQGYASVYVLVDAIRRHISLRTGGFINSGTELVTQSSVTEPYNLPAISFAQLQAIDSTESMARTYYNPLVTGPIKNWQTTIEPESDETAP
jgi:ABC-type sugar transport system substrate-binding protein